PLAVVVPKPAHFPTTTGVRDGVDHAAVEHGEPEDGEARIHGGLVAAIAIKQHRVLPVEWEVGVVDQANRDLRAVRRGGPDAGRLVVGRVEFLAVRTGEDLLLLAQNLLPGSQVEHVDPGGRRKGRKDETQDGRIPLAIPRSTDGRNLLAEVD